MKNRVSPILFVFISIAALLWYGNKLGKRFVAEITIPVYLDNDYAAQMWISDPDIEIRCQVEGVGIRLLSYRWGIADRVSIPISSLVGAIPALDSEQMARSEIMSDSEKPRPTAYCIGRSSITSSLAMSASDFRVIQVIDSSLTLNVWPIASRMMPIRSRIKTDPAAQHMQLGGVQFSPCSVMVRGPLLVLDTMSWVATQERHLDKISATQTGRIEIMAPASVELSQQVVDYKVEIAPYTQQKLTLPVRSLGVPDGLNAMTVPNSVVLSLNVPLEMCDELRPERIYACVRYSNASQNGKGRYIVSIDSLLQGVEVMSITPADVELFTTIKH